ncbi:MAG: hypothetical protein H7836_01315 [Magnetococcus sp. YQC-3]
MAKPDKTLWHVLSGCADADLSFEDLRGLLAFLVFEERIQDDHHIFHRAGVAEILIIQPKNGNAKPFQVNQVRNLILKYKLGLPYDDTL